MTRRLAVARAALACALALSGAAHAADLAREIPRILAESAPAKAAFWGIQVVDLASGRTLYELNPGKLFVPASNTKLFTGALALSRLGGSFTFQTRVLAESAPDASGRIRGPLILAGGGDPNLSGRTLPYRVNSPPGNPLAAIEDLAAQVAARGVKEIGGDIIGDDSWYLWEPYAEGWAVDDPQYDFGAPVSALAVNDNTVTVTMLPGAHAGDPATVVIDPAIEYYNIENRVVTAAAGTVSRISFERSPGGFHLRVWGALPLDDRGHSISLAVEDPALFAAMALRQALTARGVHVTGEAVARHLYPNEVTDLKQAQPVPEPARTELARRTSAPLVEDLRAALKESINLHAEMALRAVGRARRGIGSREAGLEELRAFLDEAGVARDAADLNDGSGLSRLNLVSPSAVVALLRYMHRSPVREDWISLLPVGGQDGTLSGRFKESAAAGRIFAKTGTLSHASAISGYARRPGGGMIAFSILVNNYAAPASAIRGVMDRICTLMVE